MKTETIDQILQSDIAARFDITEEQAERIADRATDGADFVRIWENEDWWVADAAPYPEAFFIVHKRFGSFGWGDVGDGPVLEDGLTDVLIEAWKDEDREPNRNDFRVWGIALGRSEDRTAWALRNMTETRKERQ